MGRGGETLKSCTPHKDGSSSDLNHVKKGTLNIDSSNDISREMLMITFGEGRRKK
jgi:hypothetical protein